MERLNEKRNTVFSDKNTKSKPMIIEESGLHHEESEALVDVVNAGVGTNDLLELTSETNTLRRQLGSDSGTDSRQGPLTLEDLKI